MDYLIFCGFTRVIIIALILFQFYQNQIINESKNELFHIDFF